MQTDEPSGRSSKRSSMLGSLKKLSLSRKDRSHSPSNAGRISRSRSPSFRSPVAADFSPAEGPAELESPAIGRQRGNSASIADMSADLRGSSNPFSNLSPPTRRPDRPGMNAFTVPSNEPPPAYTLSPTAQSGPTIPAVIPTTLVRPPSPAASTMSAATFHSTITTSTPEDPYAFLSSFDTMFLIDDSGSMAGRSWREVSQALKSITPICTSHDADGIDIYFLNHKSSDQGAPKTGAAPSGYRNVTKAEDVEKIFRTVRPSGGTPTGTRCHNILKPYLNLLQTAISDGKDIEEVGIKPLNIIVLTDGVPSDDVESVLLSAAKKLDKMEAPPYQVGVQFFQVGNEDGAREALRELDDGLVELVEGGVRDMVDTVTFTGGPLEGNATAKLTGETVLKAVLGAVVKRLDRRRTSGEGPRR